MKHISQYVLLLIVLVAGFTACQKADKLPSYGEGSAPQLTASASVVNPPPADSNKVVLTLNWSDPGHAQDKSLYKYYLEVDSSGRNFSKATILNVTVDQDKRTYAFVAKDLNSILLSYGFQFNVAYDIDIRLVSSYGNNNDQKKSNIVKVKATPYKIPPKVQLPSSGGLFIVGAATQGGWENPVPVPTQELQKIDETTYGGIFQLNGAEEYLLLPVNGSWDTKYAISDNMLPGVADAGSFFFSSGPGSNFKAPANSGFYKITVDFQLGKYKVEPFTQQHGLPSDLFMVGGATPGGWNNPVPVPSQQLTRRNSAVWDVTLNFTSGQAYLLLPTNGAWDRKFGADDPLAPNSGLGGKIKPEGADIPAPSTSGSYKFSVDFYNGTYKLTPQ
jgi:hypothetical protein